MRQFTKIAAFLLVPFGVLFAEEIALSSNNDMEIKFNSACKLMVGQVINSLVNQLAGDPVKIESAACTCVNAKLRADPIFLAILGNDLEAKQRISSQKNIQLYMTAKGTSYTFECLAPELAKVADNAIN